MISAIAALGGTTVVVYRTKTEGEKMKMTLFY